MSILKLRGTELDAVEPVPSLAADLLELTKPRISVFVALAAALGAALGAPQGTGVWTCLGAGALVMLTAAGACAFNQALERDIDRVMERTRERPLPAGRVSVGAAILFATLLGGAGVVGLALAFNLLAALCALATLFLYVAVYTPIKRYSTLNTVVGALPGAAPPLIGYLATADATGAWGWALFAVLFVWQFPHFLAIAWLYRQDYARAGLKMLPALPGGEGVTGRAAFFHALVLVPVSLLPSVIGLAGATYAGAALALGFVYLAAAARFAWRSERASARVLLVTSLLYLPALFTCVLLDDQVQAQLFTR